MRHCVCLLSVCSSDVYSLLMFGRLSLKFGRAGDPFLVLIDPG
jgi:hypothetical protein